MEPDESEFCEIIRWKIITKERLGASLTVAAKAGSLIRSLTLQNSDKGLLITVLIPLNHSSDLIRWIKKMNVC